MGNGGRGGKRLEGLGVGSSPKSPGSPPPVSNVVQIRVTQGLLGTNFPVRKKLVQRRVMEQKTRKPKGCWCANDLLINTLEAPRRSWDSQDQVGPVSGPPNGCKEGACREAWPGAFVCCGRSAEGEEGEGKEGSAGWGKERGCCIADANEGTWDWSGGKGGDRDRERRGRGHLRKGC